MRRWRRSRLKNAKRLLLLLRVVMSVNGLDGGQKIVDAALPIIKDATRHKTVAAALKIVVAQIPNDATATVPDEEDDENTAQGATLEAALASISASAKPVAPTP